MARKQISTRQSWNSDRAVHRFLIIGMFAAPPISNRVIKGLTIRRQFAAANHQKQRIPCIAKYNRLVQILCLVATRVDP